MGHTRMLLWWRNFPQQRGAAIAQLPGPDAKLVPAVDAGSGLAALWRGVAGQHLLPAGRVEGIRIQAHQ